MKGLICIFLLSSALITSAQETKETEFNFKIGTGIGTLRDKLSPNLDVVVSFNSKNTSTGEFHQVALNLNTNYIYSSQDPSSNPSINSFINLIWNFPGLKNSDERNGVGVGYLIKKEGDFFQGNAFNLLYQTSILTRGLYVSPQIILTDDFNEVIPSLKMSIFLNLL